MRMTTQRLSFRRPAGWAGALLALLLVLTSCAGNVTESEEYQSLEAERDEALTAETDAGQKLTDIEGELAAAEAELVAAEEAVSSSEARISELEVAIEEEVARIDAYPPSLVDAMVAGCSGGDPLLVPTCVCAVNELQGVMPVGELFEVSFRIAEIPVDPETGVPDEAALAQIPGAVLFLEVFFDCLFAT